MLVNELRLAVKHTVRDAGRTIAGIILVAFFIMIAIGFSTAAVYMAISDAIGPIKAALSLAALFVFVAVILGLTLRRPFAATGRDAQREQHLSDVELMSHIIDAFSNGFRAGRGRPG